MAKILIVDDDRNLLSLYEQEFTDEGYEVVAVRSGAEALLRLRSDVPDLIILDIAMPGMDGIEALMRILAIDKSIPVVLNTAYSQHCKNFMTWSADAIIVKSGDLNELKETVAALLRQRGKEAPRELAYSST